MDFVCDFGVNSPQTLQNKFGEVTHSRDISSTTTQQITCMNFISLYCFLSVQYLNYISVFQLIALN